MEPPDEKLGPERQHWFITIYRTYASEIQRTILSKVGEPFLAEDLTSTVFLKALRWLKEGQSEESVRGWLYATARTTLADHWQSQSRYQTHSLVDLEDELYTEPEELAEADQHDARGRVQHLLSQLSEREREILTLRYLHGYSAAEIARVLGINAGHVRVLQLRALRHAAQFEQSERKTPAMPEQEPSLEALLPLLTPEALRSLELAREAAISMQHHFIGTEHQLLGLAEEGSLTGFLTPPGITAERIRAGIIFIYDRQQLSTAIKASQQNIPAETPASAFKMLTPRANKVLILADEERRQLSEQLIRPTHILLAIMNEGEGIGAGLLRSLGTNLLQARATLAPPTATLTCSFCGRSGSLVKHMFRADATSSEAATALICNHCIRQFNAALDEQA